MEKDCMKEPCVRKEEVKKDSQLTEVEIAATCLYNKMEMIKSKVTRIRYVLIHGSNQNEGIEDSPKRCIEDSRLVELKTILHTDCNDELGNEIMNILHDIESMVE